MTRDQAIAAVTPLIQTSNSQVDDYLKQQADLAAKTATLIDQQAKLLAQSAELAAQGAALASTVATSTDPNSANTIVDILHALGVLPLDDVAPTTHIEPIQPPSPPPPPPPSPPLAPTA